MSRPIQFSLFTLFVLVTIVSVLLAVGLGLWRLGPQYRWTALVAFVALLLSALSMAWHFLAVRRLLQPGVPWPNWAGAAFLLLGVAFGFMLGIVLAMVAAIALMTLATSG